jgi:UDP-N-acetylmuramoyl-tripeptide--D-alanyl-D-alanine ligase
MLKTILSQGKTVAAPPHSYNTPLAIAQFIQRLNGKEQVLIFELGEYYPGDVRKLCEFVQPSVGIITGVNEAHLEKFKTLEHTRKTIFELADFVGAKHTYVNGENVAAQQQASDESQIYTRGGIADWKVEEAHTSLAGTSFTVVTSDAWHPLRSQLLGLHQIGPLVAGARMAADLGLSWEQIAAGVAATAPFDHRLQPKTDATGVTTLDDSYNGNPDGVKAVIDFLRSLSGRRRWYVTPGLVEMGARLEEVHKTIGRQLAEARIEKVVLIKNSVTPFIEQGLREAHYAGEVRWFPSALEALAALPQMTLKGDVVLLQNDWPDQYA